MIKVPNKRGELLIKTKRIMKCYLNDEEATKNAYDSDGFLRTGDVVYYDEDYCFYIVDRIKEMFKYKSWHVRYIHLIFINLICTDPNKKIAHIQITKNKLK